MSSRPGSRATAEEDVTSSLRSSTAKRPLTKPVAPRLSTSSSATRPTSTSSARAATATSSTLSKPPTRPTTTTSSVRRPPSSAAAPTTAKSLHSTRPSSASVDVSGEESNRDGITAKPKRMSLSASIVSKEKSFTLASRAATATPARKTASSTATPTVRSNVRSPTATTKAAPISASRTASTLTTRTRPVPSTTTTSRAASSLTERKRLSTIPASPAVRGKTADPGDGKESEDASESEKKPVRPVLGTRKSTRSVLLEQRIHEFELVNQMLRSAMTADGMDSEEEEQIQQDSKETMAKLRSDLAKVREFEKEHGRMPTEEELTDMDDVPVADIPEAENTEDQSRTEKEIATLREELEQSQDQNEKLVSRLSDLTARMAYFGQSAEEESKKVEEITEAIRIEHASKIEELLALHQSQIEELEASREHELEVVSEQHRTAIEEIEQQKQIEFLDKNTELEALRTELRDIKAQVEVTSSSQPPPPPQEQSSSESSELEVVKKQLKATQDRHQVAKDNAKSKIAKAQQEYAREVAELKSRHSSELADLQHLLEEAQISSNDLDARFTRKEELHAEALQELETAKAEIETLKNARNDVAKANLETISKLNKELETLGISKIEDAELSEQTITKLKAGHDEEMQKLRTQLKAATSELETNTEISEKHYSEALQKANDELEAAQSQLAGTLSTHNDTQKELERQLKDAIKATEAMTAAHKVELASSQQRVHEAERLAAEHEERLRSAMSKLDSKDKDIESVKSAHADEVSRLRSDSTLSHENNIESLKKEHAKVIADLEQKSNSALESLETIKSTTAAEMEQVKENATETQRAALEAQANEHKSAVAKLETQLASSLQDTADLKASHGVELEKLRSDHTQDKDSALAVLSSEHEKMLSELTTKSKASGEAIDSLKLAHSEEIQKYDAQAKSAAGELDAAKFQVQSLKSIIQSMEQEHAEKEQEYQHELEKRDTDFSQAVTKLSSQSIRIAELESAHSQAVEQAKVAVEAETRASLDALRQEHDEAVETLRKELDEKHRNTLQAFRSEHTGVIEGLSKEIETRNSDMETLKANHAQALTDLKNSSRQENDEALDKMKAEHAVALDDQKSSLNSKHEAHLQELEQRHTSRAADSAKEHDKSLERMKTEHNDAITTLRSEVEVLHKKLQDTSAADTLKAQLSASQQAFSKLQEEQTKSVSVVTEEHTKEVSKLKSQIESLESEAAKAPTAIDLEAIASQLAQAKAEQADLVNDHIKAIGQKDLEHADAIRSLQSELDEANSEVESASRLSGEVEELKKLHADAKHTVAELSEQYALASMEAENQRIAAEHAKKELNELKKSIATAKSTTEASPEDKRLNIKSNVNGTGKGSPKAGLKASKWATTEPEQSLPANSPVSPSQTNGLSDGPGTTGEEVTTPRTKQRNVAGQMAGIQEHIRQLTEMNDEFLLDHQKWARSLNRVDEDGTVTVDIDDKDVQQTGKQEEKV